ncbi:transfer/carrier protein [Lithospermum erythrorhizon]|uniref:Transfer/carrier protein n=1 Tax=Lithospermum erythrorhizon TaxID=34254 RepID=A0AAV3S1V0_LITER
MKRKREDMVVMGSSEVRSAIEELSVMVIKSEPVDGVDEIKHVPLKPFLVVCNLVIQILDKIGPRMAVLRQDIYQNIQRLEKLHESNPSLYSNVVEILKKEIAEGKAKKGPSCSKAFVWLTRYAVLHFKIIFYNIYN